MERRETGAENLKHSLEKYLAVNHLIFESNKKLEEIVKLVNSAIICQGLILNNTLPGYLEIVTSKESIKRNSSKEIIHVCAEIFDLNRDILTLIQLEISEDCAPLLVKKELAKYVKNAIRRVSSQIQCVEELIKARSDDSER